MVSENIPKKILVVDDDLFLLEIYVSAFQRAGFEVTSAKDGQEAWDILNKGLVPDVLFTGIMMPGMTGFELIQKMKLDPRFARVPLAISSHYGQADHREAARRLGVREFIFQAVTPITDAVRRITALVEGQKSFVLHLFGETEEEKRLIEFLKHDAPGTESAQKFSLELEPQDPGTFRARLMPEE